MLNIPPQLLVSDIRIQDGVLQYRRFVEVNVSASPAYLYVAGYEPGPWEDVPGEGEDE